MNHVTIDLIIFAVIAVFLFFKLRNVLGEVDETDHAHKKQKSTSHTNKTKTQKESNDRLSRLNPQNNVGQWPSVTPDFKLVKSATAHNDLIEIHQDIPSFDPYHFLQGAKRAFPMIIEALSKGDKTTLKNLLSKDLFETYSEEIDRRKKEGEIWHSELTDIKTILIANADYTQDIVSITVELEGVEKITARDREGNFIDEQDGRGEKTKMLWVFSKEKNATSHIWTLVKTDLIGE